MARADKSARIAAAVEAIQSGACTSYKECSAKYGVDRTTISKRVRGLTKSRQEAASIHIQCLTNAQEETLIQTINKLTDRGIPPTSSMVKSLAEEIRGRAVGKNWVGKFVQRHKDVLKSAYLRNLDNLRVTAEHSPMFILFFKTLQDTVEKFNITGDNFWNFDEKGFLMGFGRSMKRIMTREAYKSGRVTKAKQDGSREFISLLACVNAVGRKLPPLLIYQGSNGDLSSSWMNDVKAEDNVFFASSYNGWSSIAFGLKWLQEVFEPNTKPSSPRAKRLLLLDGHSSHVNIEFINFADRHRIIIMVLPPHTTHRLQALDVGLFQPLSTFYSEELEDLMASSGGLVQMSKSLFYKMFLRAWTKAFTVQNIQHAFKSAGYWPVDGTEIIQQVSIPAPVLKPRSPGHLKTPKDAKAIRAFRISFERSPTKAKTSKLFHTLEAIASDTNILQFHNRGLREAIIIQKQRSKRGKPLNLCGEESTGVEVYHSERVEKARLVQEQKEAEEAAERVAIEERKAAKAAKAKANVEEKISKAATRQLNKELGESQGSAGPVLKKPKASTKQLNPTVPKAKKAPVSVPIAAPVQSTTTAALEQNLGGLTAENTGVVGGGDNMRQSRPSRTVRLPQRYL